MSLSMSAIAKALPFLAIGGLVACAPLTLDHHVDAFARGTAEIVQSGDSAGLSRIVDQSLTGAASWQTWHQVVDTLRAWHPDTLELVGYNVTTGPGTYVAAITYQARSSGSTGLFHISLQRRQRGLVVTGVRVESISAPLQVTNAFTFTGRTWRHYLILALAAGAAITSLIAATLVALTPMPRRWLWALFALVGFGQFGINWATGEMFLNPVRFQLLAAGYFRPGLVGPWIISASVPLGAIWALWHRHQRGQGVSKRSAADAA